MLTGAPSGLLHCRLLHVRGKCYLLSSLVPLSLHINGRPKVLTQMLGESEMQGSLAMQKVKSQRERL